METADRYFSIACWYDCSVLFSVSASASAIIFSAAVRLGSWEAELIDTPVSKTKMSEKNFLARLRLLDINTSSCRKYRFKTIREIYFQKGPGTRNNFGHPH